jgi:arylsulfatase A-like enzyme/Tfp pilus assembly protein PilF
MIAAGVRRTGIWIAAGGAFLAAFLAFLVLRDRHLAAPPDSLLLVTIDTLRADALGSYGAAGDPTPWLDRLAAAGWRFTGAHAHNVLTLPSHANILSGRLPTQHGVRDNAGFRFPAGTETLPTLLKARGYATGAFVSAFPLDSRYGLDRGFDVYDDGLGQASAAPAFLERERGGTETVARAREWITAQGARPWLAWVHLYEPHFPYRPPEPWASRFAGDPYRGEVAAADAALQPLLEPLLAAGRNGRTLVVVTADHGEALGAHGEATHGVFAYEPTLKVPLIVFHPATIPPRVPATEASHVDVLPTVLAALGVPAPAGLSGRNLLGPADETATTVYFESLSPSLNRGWAPLRGVIRGGSKYIDLPLPELYDLASDPAEAHNLAGAQPQRVAALRALLPADAAGRTRTAETGEARERLRALGYVTGAAPAARTYTADDDPKRLIALDALLQDATARAVEGDLEGAVERCRELVRRRPGMALGWLQIGQLERARGRTADAIAALRKALSLDPGDAMALALLGSSLAQGGRPAEAVALLAPHAAGGHGDPDVRTAYGVSLARLGRFDEARQVFARARAEDPGDAQAAVELGTVEMMAGQRERARSAFEEALRADPRAARAHSSLAFLAAEQGRRDESLQHWRSAAALDARELEKLLALAAMLEQQGRRDEARAYLAFFVSSAPPAYAPQVARVRAWLQGG